MEICRKLDSIRTSGFPDAGEVATAAAGGTGEAVDLSGPPPPRPRSEPLPESILAVASMSGEERRPGTAVSRRGSIAAAAAAAAAPTRGQSHGGVGNGGTSAAGENGNKVDGAPVGEERGVVRSNNISSASPSPTGRPNHCLTASDIGVEGLTLEAAEANGSGGGITDNVELEAANVDRNTTEGHGAPAPVVAQKVRTGAKKPSSVRREKVGFLRIFRNMEYLVTYKGSRPTFCISFFLCEGPRRLLLSLRKPQRKLGVTSKHQTRAPLIMKN